MVCIVSLVAGSSAYLAVSFTDKDGLPAVPSAVSFSIYCLTTDITIRQDIDAGVPASSMEIQLQSTDNDLQDLSNTREKRRVVVKAEFAINDQKLDIFDYYVVNPETYE